MARKSWPLTGHYKDQYWAFVAVIKTGIIVFCVADWGRGDVDICNRAAGSLAGRDMTWMQALGSCQSFANECYPNLKSAVLRWPVLKNMHIPEAPHAR